MSGRSFRMRSRTAAVATMSGATAISRCSCGMYCASTPRSRATAWCLSEAGIAPDQLDHIAVGRDPRANLGARIRRRLRDRPGPGYVRERLSVRARVRDVGGTVADAIGADRGSLRARLHNV